MASRIIRSRAPLRLGLAGGGTDVPPYSDDFGGCVLNVTIDRYASATIQTCGDDRIRFSSSDLRQSEEFACQADLPINSGLKLHRGVYNRMIRDFNEGRPIPLSMTTHVDSPLGSGLGSSSALVVAMVAAMAELLGAALGEYDLAHLAFEIERQELGLNGGKQDQYAAAFGGFNFMEFGPGSMVVVNPLRIRAQVAYELTSSLVLFFSGVSRESARIIKNQSDTVRIGGDALAAMHQIKDEAIRMKQALLFGDVDEIGRILERSWQAKKRTSSAVSNPHIEQLYAAAIEAGAVAGKVSGAGGGGFLMFLVDPMRRADVARRLSQQSSGRVETCGITLEGAVTWYARERSSQSVVELRRPGSPL